MIDYNIVRNNPLNKIPLCGKFVKFLKNQFCCKKVLNSFAGYQTMRQSNISAIFQVPKLWGQQDNTFKEHG